jgi:hypothetical protein
LDTLTTTVGTVAQEDMEEPMVVKKVTGMVEERVDTTLLAKLCTATTTRRGRQV